MEIRRGTHQLYKGSSFLVFYDRADERIKYMFDNVREILKFLGKEVTRSNVNKVNVEIYRALKREGHFTRLLNGKILRLYMINLEDEDD